MSLLTPTLSAGASGDAAAALAWERYVRPALWSTWSPQIAGVECADAVIRTGSTGTVLAAPRALGLRIPFEVVEVDPDAMRWTWIATLPIGVRLRLEHTVTAVGTGSRTGIRVSGPAPIVLGYVPLAVLALRRLVTEKR